ncbi:MAG: response regulator FixJ [Acidobacteriota bacterium]
MMAAESTVHIVDDDEAVRDSLSALLESMGFTVATYDSAEAFLAAPAASGSCIVVDVRMPGMGGLELQEEIARRGSRIPVIVMTGHADVSLAVRAMKAGAFDFVEKPFDETALVGAIRRACDLGREVARSVAAGTALRERLALLTPREREVLDALVAGKANKIIAYELSISPRTVEIHRARVMEKMQARTLADLVRMTLTSQMRPKSD